MGMPMDSPEATTTQPPTTRPDLHTVSPMPMDARTGEALAPTTTGVREDCVPALERAEGTLLSTPAPPIDASLAVTEGPVRLANGPDAQMGEALAPTTTGAREDCVPAPERAEGTLSLTSAPPTGVPLAVAEGPVRLANGPDAQMGKALAPTTTGAREDCVPAPERAEGTLSSTSAPPTGVSLAVTEEPPRLANGPAPKKRKVATPAVVSNTISDKYGFFLQGFTRCFSDSAIRNLCRQDWLKSHEGGMEDEFKAYWLGLPEEEIKVCVVASFFQVYLLLCVHISGGNRRLLCRYVKSVFYVLVLEQTDTAPPSEEGSQ